MACTHAKEPPTTATSERLGTASSRPLSSGPQTTRLAVPKRYPVDVGENVPLLWQFCTARPRRCYRVAIGENFAQHEDRCVGDSDGVIPVETGKNFAYQEVPYTEDSDGASVQHAAIAKLPETTTASSSASNHLR